MTSTPTSSGVKAVDNARKDYTVAGYRFVECTLCGARHNAGRVGNSTDSRYARVYKDEWWEKHITECPARLKQQVETLKAGMSTKDEALGNLIDAVVAELSAGKAEGRTIFGCEVEQAVKYAEEALSLTPASVAEYAANERIGRAVRGWANMGLGRYGCHLADCVGLELAPDFLPDKKTVVELGKVIAKAREAKS